MRKDFVIGLDLAKRFDRSFFVALERTPLGLPILPEGDGPDSLEDEPLLLRLFYALQVPQGTSYEDVARHAAALASHPKLRGRVQFAVDVTGVGEAVLEILRQQPALDDVVWAVTITPGQRTSRKDGMRFSVPKKDLVDTTLVALQRRRLKACPGDLYHMDVLRKQLFAFKRKVDPRTLVASYSAIDESIHDDGAVSLCLAVWLSGQLPLEEGEAGDGDVPHVLLEGPARLPRPAETWRGDGGPETHRPAGNAPSLRGPAGLPPQPHGRPNPDR